MENYRKKIGEAFEDGDREQLLETIDDLLKVGYKAIDIVKLLSEEMNLIGEKFSIGELFLPDMVIAGDLMEEAMDFLKPMLSENGKEIEKLGKVVLGSVRGDIHEIGKNMVKTMLSISGFEVLDLGTDVSAENFFEKVLSEKPEFLALSSCMTTTVPSMRDTIDLVRARHLEGMTAIVVGGGSMSPMLADKLGCIYGGIDAFALVNILKTYLARK